MTPERFRQIEALYHAAREATADERAALLAQTDPELRHEVESLLSERNGGEFLDRPAIQNTPRPSGGLDGRPHWMRARAWVPTASKASSAKAAWAKSFARSTRD